jgi:ethylbenzene dioxygenase ferredoxin component
MIDNTMIKICDVADIAHEHGYKVEIEGIGTLAVFFFEGSYFVVDDKCTHGVGSLSDGKISGDQVICPFHRGAFNFRTGVPTVRPCTIALKTYATHMVGTTICIADPATAV